MASAEQVRNEFYQEAARKEKAARHMLVSLKQALRFIEVKYAYQGAMTAAEVEARIKANADVAQLDIAANSVHTLASFHFHDARAAIAAAEAAGIKG